jgi:hypothetical protein
MILKIYLLVFWRFAILFDIPLCFLYSLYCIQVGHVLQNLLLYSIKDRLPNPSPNMVVYTADQLFQCGEQHFDVMTCITMQNSIISFSYPKCSSKDLLTQISIITSEPNYTSHQICLPPAPRPECHPHEQAPLKPQKKRTTSPSSRNTCVSPTPPPKIKVANLCDTSVQTTPGSGHLLHFPALHRLRNMQKVILKLWLVLPIYTSCVMIKYLPKMDMCC